MKRRRSCHKKNNKICSCAGYEVMLIFAGSVEIPVSGHGRRTMDAGSDENPCVCESADQKDPY